MESIHSAGIIFSRSPPTGRCARSASSPTPASTCPDRPVPARTERRAPCSSPTFSIRSHRNSCLHVADDRPADHGLDNGAVWILDRERRNDKWPGYRGASQAPQTPPRMSMFVRIWRYRVGAETREAFDAPMGRTGTGRGSSPGPTALWQPIAGPRAARTRGPDLCDDRPLARAIRLGVVPHGPWRRVSGARPAPGKPDPRGED